MRHSQDRGKDAHRVYKALEDRIKDLEIQNEELLVASREASRLLGFALFNHYKDNRDATATLVVKAFKALTGKDWQ